MKRKEPIDSTRRGLMTAAGFAGLAALAPLEAKAGDPDVTLVSLRNAWHGELAKAEALTEAASAAWSRAAEEFPPSPLEPGHATSMDAHRAACDRELEGAGYHRLSAEAKLACGQVDSLEQQIIESPARGVLGLAAKLEVALDHLDEEEGRAVDALRAALHDARALAKSA